jgi:hypothetical protein
MQRMVDPLHNMTAQEDPVGGEPTGRPACGIEPRSLSANTCSEATGAPPARAENQLAQRYQLLGNSTSRYQESITTQCPPAQLRAELLHTGILEVPLTGEVALLAVDLKNLHGDRAGRFITATAIAHDTTLITADDRLLRWRGKVKRQHANK